MLDAIRNAVNSWIAKLLLGILLLCFVLLWGIPQLHESTSNDLFVAGKSKVSSDTYRLTLADQTIRLSIRYNKMFTQSDLKDAGIPQSVLKQLQQNVLLDEQARQMKIGISKDGIAKAISEDKGFQQENAFSKKLFLGYLRIIRSTENDFINYFVEREKRNQLVQSAITGIKVPNFYASNLVAYEGETRTADYLVLTPKELGPIADPEQSVLEKWFEDNKQTFRAPEYRKVSFFKMTPTDLMKPQDISTDDLKTYYDSNLSRYAIAEKRGYEELRFSTREAADAAAKKLSEKISFEDLVKEQNKTLKDITKGPISKAELPTLMASEVFALDKNAVSAVINDLQGPVIIRVTDIVPETHKPFESVENEIRQILAQNNAAKQMKENHDAIENSSFEGASLTEIATQYKLPLRDVTIDKTATTPEGNVITDLPEKDNFLTAILASEAGNNANSIAIQNGGYIWYKVESIIPARDKPLEEVKQAAIDAWKKQETQIRLNAKANELEKQLAAGKSIHELAEQLNTTQKVTGNLKRDATDPNLGSIAIKSMFAGPDGKTGFANGTSETDRIIYKITGIIEPLNVKAEALKAETRQNIDAILGDDILIEMLDQANKETPVKVNTQNYNRIINSL